MQLTSDSTLVLVTDTWLHFSTKSIIFTQVGPNLDQSGLGFAINPNCTGLGVAGKDYTACVAYKLLNGYVESGNEALKIFANVSDIMSVPIHTDGEDRYAYVANPQTTRLASLDYTVETYAIHSQCKPVTPQCTNKSMELGNNINYTCPFAFKGTVDTLDRTGNADVTMAFFTNSTGKESIASSRGSFKNPYYYAAMLLTGLNMGGSDALAEDPDVLGPLYDSGTLVAVFCNSTIYDVTYSSINGTIKNWNPTLSNDTTTELFQAGAELIRMGMPYLIQAVSVAGFSDSGQDIADQFALAYSRNALATTAMTFVPQDALVSQQREQIQVAMVPKIPLYALISANLLLVVLGCILTTVALIALRGNTGEVQARLSVHALVAKAFEERAVNPVKEAEDLFEEKHSRQGPRLEFVRTNKGGWTVGRHVPDPVPIPEPLQ